MTPILRIEDAEDRKNSKDKGKSDCPLSQRQLEWDAYPMFCDSFPSNQLYLS